MHRLTRWFRWPLTLRRPALSSQSFLPGLEALGGTFSPAPAARLQEPVPAQQIHQGGDRFEGHGAHSGEVLGVNRRLSILAAAVGRGKQKEQAARTNQRASPLSSRMDSRRGPGPPLQWEAHGPLTSGRTRARPLRARPFVAVLQGSKHHG